MAVWMWCLLVVLGEIFAKLKFIIWDVMKYKIVFFLMFSPFWGVFEEWIKLVNWGIILPQFFWFLTCLVC
jgi:hypothetical protein